MSGKDERDAVLDEVFRGMTNVQPIGHWVPAAAEHEAMIAAAIAYAEHPTAVNRRLYRTAKQKYQRATARAHTDYQALRRLIDGRLGKMQEASS